MEAILFDLDEVIPVDGGIVAVLTLVDDDDEYPPIVAVRCPDCGEMVEDFRQHDCCRK